jgi:D-glycero-D-manno-heptose 1,7-bisphosphate phosphatase
MPRSKKIAVFLDRDGTIIHDGGYLKNPAQVRFLPGAGKALFHLSELGLSLVLVSNQSGIGGGKVTLEEAKAVHQQMLRQLAQFSVRLDAAYYCFHAPGDGCSCRKPAPGMLLLAAEKCNLDLTHSFLVGDKGTDIEAGLRAGCQTILLSSRARTRLAISPPHAMAGGWSEVVHFIECQAKA